MAELSAADHKIRKAIGEAEKGLFKLYKEIGPTNFDIKLNKLDKGKIMSARAKVAAFMKKFTPITKIQGGPAYDQLTPYSQRLVDWMDAILGILLKNLLEFDKAAKLASKDPSKNLKIMIPAAQKPFRQLRKPPSGLGTLVKQIEKDFGPDAPGFSGVSILPALIMLFLIWETIAAGLKKKPKGD